MPNERSQIPVPYHRMLQVFENMGVTLTAGLPDDWVSPLLDLLDESQNITNVRVAREPEIIGICSGAFFGGVKSVGIMGATGFLTCISELATVNLKYQIPLLLVVSLRGSIYDHQAFQEVQGRFLLKQCDAMGLPVVPIAQASDLDLIPDAYMHSRIQKRPCIIGVAKTLLVSEVEEE